MGNGKPLCLDAERYRLTGTWIVRYPTIVLLRLHLLCAYIQLSQNRHKVVPLKSPNECEGCVMFGFR